MSVKERLIEYLKFKGISKTDFGRSIGVSSAYVTSIRKSIDPEKIQSIALKYPDLNMEWLLAGQGEMLKPQPAVDTNAQEQDEFYTGQSPVTITVPMLPLAAAAGTLSDFSGTALPYQCEMIISPIRGAEMAIKVSGESMAPEIPNGSQILIKRIDEKAFIEWGRIYVLDTRNGAVVKRIMPSDRDGAVKCVSVNPEFPPFDVSFTDIFGVYRVLMCMSLK